MSIEHTDPINTQILAVSEDKIQGFVREPFDEIAALSGLPIETVLERIRGMLAAGTIRRVRQMVPAASIPRMRSSTVSIGRPLRAAISPKGSRTKP